jgi:ferredoxin-NADP reductase
MFVTIAGDTPLRKHFTISSSPTEDFIEFTKKLTDSDFSHALTNLKVGDSAAIEGPHGTFTLEEDIKKAAMLSGGIGITPIRSMVKYCQDTSLDTDIIILYGNATETDIVFREELTALKAHNIAVVLTVDEAAEGWTGNTGRIDASMIKKEIPDYEERVFYVCGPPAMVKAMDAVLTGLGVHKSHIKKEHFSGY